MNQTQKAMLASWVKVFIAALIAAITATGTAPWDWTPDQALGALWSAISATLVVVYNYLDPADTRYGPTSTGE